MKHTALILPFAALALAAPPALAADAPAHEQASTSDASIPFVNHGGVRDWRAVDSRTIYFQDTHRQWYRAELFARAIDLPFAQTIGIDARPSGTLDKWGAILVRGQRYPFASFERVDGPPTKRG